MELVAQVDALSNDDVLALIPKQQMPAQFDMLLLKQMLAKLEPLLMAVAEALLAGQPKSMIVLVVLRELFRIKLV